MINMAQTEIISGCCLHSHARMRLLFLIVWVLFFYLFFSVLFWGGWGVKIQNYNHLQCALTTGQGMQLYFMHDTSPLREEGGLSDQHQLRRERERGLGEREREEERRRGYMCVRVKEREREHPCRQWGCIYACVCASFCVYVA